MGLLAAEREDLGGPLGWLLQKGSCSESRWGKRESPCPWEERMPAIVLGGL